jgi:alkyl hydroperoxide reductase subunit AhpC
MIVFVILFIHRAMFIIDDKGIVRQITINDRSVGRSVPETCRLIKAIQHAAKLRESTPVTGFVEGKKNDNYECFNI